MLLFSSKSLASDDFSDDPYFSRRENITENKSQFISWCLTRWRSPVLKAEWKLSCCVFQERPALSSRLFPTQHLPSQGLLVCVCARDVVECGCRSRAGAAPSLSMPTSCQSLFRRELPPSRLFQHHHLLAPHCKMTWWLCLVQTVAGLWHRVWDSGSVLTDVYSTHHSRVETSYRD